MQAMSIYAVFLNQKDDKAWDAVQREWPKGRCFILDGRLAFVAPEGITTTAEIAKIVGINKENDRLGIVFEYTAHSGYNRGDLWEWLEKVKA